MGQIYIWGNATPWCGEGTTASVIDWRYDFSWYVLGSQRTYCEQTSRAITVPTTASVATIKQAILDDMKAWASAQGHTILRITYFDFSSPVV